MQNTLKNLLKNLFVEALKKINLDSASDKIQIDYAKTRAHGDFACNIALLLAKQTARPPRELAEEIILHLPPHEMIENIQTAGAGFINIKIYPQAFKDLLAEVSEKKSAYGISQTKKNKKIHIEFVSSNPTGPLHVGHGRGAAYGATLSNLLEARGFEVHREYYVNDAGRQMDILAVSLFLRYLSLCGEEIIFPSKIYQGEYVIDIAQKLYQEKQQQYYFPAKVIFENLENLENLENTEADQQAQTEIYIDQLISRTKKLLGEKNYKIIFNYGLDIILKDIREDLAEFGVAYNAWFSEQSLWDKKLVEQAIESLRQKNHLYEKDGAVWFRSTDFGDDKDRVVIRENGQYTYFASDIAYHQLKCEHYEDVIDVLGADHHGYIPRLKAIIQALGHDVKKFHVPLVQFAVLYRGKERVSMSTRAGSFVTLRELRREVGNDAARFFYIMRKADQHLDFDLALAKSQSNENPVYYLQYAHARICSIFRQLKEKKLEKADWSPQTGLDCLDKLTSDTEKTLLLTLLRYEETLDLSAALYEPHLLAYYLKELCENFHSYYNAFQFLVTDDKVRHARLCLCHAVRQILANGLSLLGVSAPESM